MNEQVASMKEKDHVQTKIESILNHLYKDGIRLSHSMQPQINTLVTLLSPIESNREIPVNYCQLIDEGINPDLLQKDQLIALASKNQKLKGRLVSLALFKDELESLVAVNFPAVYSEYQSNL